MVRLTFTPVATAVGSVEGGLLNKVAGLLDIPVSGKRLDPEFAYSAARGQYHSTEILARLPEGTLGICDIDLYIPILEFVFGEAQLGGGRAIISLFRLRQEFYGLPPDPALMVERAVREALHELGHAVGLRHCPSYTCAMHATHSVELLDLKMNGYCRSCARHLKRPVPVAV